MWEEFILCVSLEADVGVFLVNKRKTGACFTAVGAKSLSGAVN